MQHAAILEFHRKLTQLGANRKDSEMMELLEDMEKVHKVYPNTMSFELGRALLWSKLRSHTASLKIMRTARAKTTDSTAIALLRLHEYRLKRKWFFFQHAR